MLKPLFFLSLVTQAPLLWLTLYILTAQCYTTEAIATLSYQLEMDYLTQVGWHHYVQGHLTNALATFQTLLDRCQAQKDDLGTIDALNRLGLAYCGLTRYSQATIACEEAYLLATQHGLVGKAGNSLSNLGWIHRQMERIEEALQYYQRALVAFIDAKDPVGMGLTLNNMGVLYSQQGDYGRSHQLCLVAVSVLEDAREQGGEATAHYNTALLYGRQKNYADAIKHLQRSLSIRIAIGDFSGEASVLMSFGQIYQEMQQPFHALSCYQEAVELQRSMGRWEDEAQGLQRIADIYEQEGMPLSALDYYQRALSVQQFLGDREGMARIGDRVSRLHRETGHSPGEFQAQEAIEPFAIPVPACPSALPDAVGTANPCYLRALVLT